MPQIAQEPLSPLKIDIEVELRPTQFPPSGYTLVIGTQWHMVRGRMTYYGNHVWGFSATVMAQDWRNYGLYCDFVETPCHINSTLALTWSDPSISISVGLDLTNAPHLATGWHSQLYPGCERGTPWGMPWTPVTQIDGPHNVRVLPARDLSPLAPLLPSLANSPTVHGPIGNHSVITGPVYPENAIFGETPPEKTLTYMRRKAQRDFTTHPALRERQEAFSSAATQWNALSGQQRANWTAAGRTCRPRVAGYALFTEILSTKRLDLMRLLEARTALSLVPPVYPT